MTNILFLGSIDIFSSLREDELSVLGSVLEYSRIESGMTLFKEGDAGEELFIVESGRLGISVALADGGSVEIAEFGPRDFFGEMSIFQGEPRSASCTAKEAGTLLSLKAADFFSLSQEYPGTAIKIMRAMLGVTTTRLKTTNRFLTGMVRWGEEARRRAVSDEFTGLYNRGFFDTSLERRAAEARTGGTCLSLAMTDLDGFGRLNARFGEELCNHVILEAVQVFRRVFPEGNILARYGGDEFAFILPGRNAREAQKLCNAVCEELRKVVVETGNGGDPIGVTASIGISCIPDNAANGAGLLKTADKALYAAKELGRDRTACYGEFPE
jgi:diguanylate cyclase (GGDEF)-like protein